MMAGERLYYYYGEHWLLAQLMRVLPLAPTVLFAFVDVAAADRFTPRDLQILHLQVPVNTLATGLGYFGKPWVIRSTGFIVQCSRPGISIRRRRERHGCSSAARRLL